MTQEHLKYVNAPVNKGKIDLNFFLGWKKKLNKCQDISIDYAVLEKTKEIMVFEATFEWNDLGDWYAVWENWNDISKK